MRFWLILALFMVIGAVPVRAEMIVYELFTARDCPSCPAADEIFLNIARANPHIIALSCHVTYFDRPGRKDKLSAPFCDGRQTGYRNAKVLSKIYTPAVVVNGAHSVKGNNSESVLTGLQAGSMESVRNIPLVLEDGYLNIALPSMAMAAPAEIWLFAYDQNRAVIFLTKLMRWNGKPSAMAFPVANIPARGFAVVAQTTGQTNIRAAGQTW